MHNKWIFDKRIRNWTKNRPLNDFESEISKKKKKDFGTKNIKSLFHTSAFHGVWQDGML